MPSLARSYVKRPEPIEAMQVPPVWDGIGTPDGIAKIAVWLGTGGAWELQGNGSIAVKSNFGWQTAEIGDWIIRSRDGELYPIKNDVFLRTYDEVPSGASERDETYCPRCDRHGPALRRHGHGHPCTAGQQQRDGYDVG